MSQARHRVARGRALLAIPAALATATSVIFGLHAGHVVTPLDTDGESEPAFSPTGSPSSVSPAPMQLSREKDGTYVVASGDTLMSIASGFKVSSVELLAANGLSWRTLLVVGQRLQIPTSTSGTAEHDRIDTVAKHHVVAGDTLEAIARRYSVQPRALLSANGLSAASRLIVGQRLLIPNAQVMSGIEALT